MKFKKPILNFVAARGCLHSDVSIEYVTARCHCFVNQ